MPNPHWSAVLSRIVPQDADDLGELTARYDPRHVAPGADVFPDCADFVQLPGAFKREDSICVGLRVLAPLPDAHDRAMRLAASGAPMAEAETAYRDAAERMRGSGMPGLEDGLLPLALLCLRVQHRQPAQTDRA